MVDIKLISLKEHIAEIECVPNGDNNKKFKLTLDCLKRRIIRTDIEITDNPFVSHAVYRVYKEYKNTNTVPDYCTVVWC